MKTILLIAAVLGVAVLAREADGAEKVKRPTVCMSYRIVEPGLAVCSDGKKPALFRRFEEKEIPGQESGRVKVLLGWR